MKTLDYLFHQVVHSHPFENCGLVTILVKNLVKFVLFGVLLVRRAVYTDLCVIYHFQRFAPIYASLAFIR